MATYQAEYIDLNRNQQLYLSHTLKKAFVLFSTGKTRFVVTAHLMEFKLDNNYSFQYKMNTLSLSRSHFTG